MASSPSPGYSITLRVAVSPSAGSTTDLASAVAETGAAVTALDIVESSHDVIVVDVTCNTVDEEHAQRISEALDARPGTTVSTPTTMVTASSSTIGRRCSSTMRTRRLGPDEGG